MEFELCHPSEQYIDFTAASCQCTTCFLRPLNLITLADEISQSFWGLDVFVLTNYLRGWGSSDHLTRPFVQHPLLGIYSVPRQVVRTCHHGELLSVNNFEMTKKFALFPKIDSADCVKGNFNNGRHQEIGMLLPCRGCELTVTEPQRTSVDTVSATHRKLALFTTIIICVLLSINLALGDLCVSFVRVCHSLFRRSYYVCNERMMRSLPSLPQSAQSLHKRCQWSQSVSDISSLGSSKYGGVFSIQTKKIENRCVFSFVKLWEIISK